MRADDGPTTAVQWGASLMSRQREADEAAGSAAVERRTPVVRGPAPVALALAGDGAAARLSESGAAAVPRSAGNAAVARLPGGGLTQRCGPIPCDCDEEETRELMLKALYDETRDADKLRFVTFWDNWLLAQAEREIPELARP